MAPLDGRSDIIWLNSTTSTNYELRQRKDSLDNLSIVATYSQTAGRGQGDHIWHSEPGANLTFSILMRFPLGSEYDLMAYELLHITEVTTLGITDYLSTKGIGARIKWPNDIWVDDRKICGILIENRLDHGHIVESIVGIGLNVNEIRWPEELPNPVSIRELTGKEYRIEEELTILKEKICRRYELLSDAHGKNMLNDDFGKLMFRLYEDPELP